MSSLPTVVGFLDRIYRDNLVAIQIPRDAGCWRNIFRKTKFIVK